MYTPALSYFGHLLEDLFAQHLAVLDDVVDRRVGNLVAYDGARHSA